MDSQTLDSNSYIRKSESSKTRIIVTNGTWSWSLGSRSRFENCPHLYQNKFEFKIKKNYGVPTSWTPSHKSEDCKNDYLQSTTQLKEVFNLDWVAMWVTSHIRNLKNGLEHQNYMSIVQKVKIQGNQKEYSQNADISYVISSEVKMTYPLVR